jgi:hypothetical protein
MFLGDAYAEAIAPNNTDRAQADECADLAREFPGWEITWTSTWGYRARKGDNRIPACSSRSAVTSRSAIRCLLAVTEFHRMSA